MLAHLGRVLGDCQGVESYFPPMRARRIEIRFSPKPARPSSHLGDVIKSSRRHNVIFRLRLPYLTSA